MTVISNLCLVGGDRSGRRYRCPWRAAARTEYPGVAGVLDGQVEVIGVPPKFGDDPGHAFGSDGRRRLGRALELMLHELG